MSNRVRVSSLFLFVFERYNILFIYLFLLDTTTIGTKFGRLPKDKETHVKVQERYRTVVQTE